jgi:subtilisin family serine protease
VNNGRNGKGCVVLFAAGNGNEDVKFDGYASYEKVIAVAACNDTNKRSVYSDYGKSVWCCFPSSDFAYPEFSHPAPLTPGIYTTDRRGSQGYGVTDYTNGFGGTSSSCPGAAGIAALILSVNPGLSWQQVKNVIRDSCEKIDIQGGDYNADGRSPKYGYGKPDASKAVSIALEMKRDQLRKVRILSAVVNPKGKDIGKEKVSLFNLMSDQDIDLTGWVLKVKTKKQQLSGILPKGEALPITLDSKVKLSNTGGTLVLINPDGDPVHEVTYKKSDVKEGAELMFAS